MRPELAELPPEGNRRMGANPHANGGVLLKDLAMPDFREYAVPVPKPGGATAEATRVMGRMLRDVMKRNREARNFRVMEILSEHTCQGWPGARLCDTSGPHPAGDAGPEDRALAVHHAPWRGYARGAGVDVAVLRQMSILNKKPSHPF